MAGKYTPLELYLRNIPSEVRDITLSFSKIEVIIDSRLPSSAYKYPAWWGNEKNGSHVEAHAWLGAGWSVESIDWESETVRFVRI